MWACRVVTPQVPALIVHVVRQDPTQALVISQVVAFHRHPFAVIPLMRYRDKGTHGQEVG